MEVGCGVGFACEFAFSAVQSRTTNGVVGLPEPLISWTALATSYGYGPRICVSGVREERRAEPVAEVSARCGHVDLAGRVVARAAGFLAGSVVRVVGLHRRRAD
jgi:hypothetical protein